MIEQGLFKRHFIGRDGFQWWIGQVAPEDSWTGNQPGVPVDTNEDSSYKGFGERVRVRIMGYHTESVEAIPDEELPWATVMYPVTAGGGGRASSQSMNLVGGNFVFGFFIDGEDAQQPIIMGVLGYNDYQEVTKSLDDDAPRFVPHSSYDKKQEKDKVSPFSVKEGGSGQTAGQTNSKGKSNNDLIIESVQSSNSLKEMSAKEMERKGKIEEPLSQTEDCDPIPTTRIQKQVQNIVREIEHIQKSIKDPRNAISVGKANLPKEIQTLQKQLARHMSANTKSILQQTQKKIIKELNDKAKDSFYSVMPNQRPEVRLKIEKANDQVSCLYTKLYDGLFDTMMDMLTDMLGPAGELRKAINFPLCYVDDIVGNKIGTILDELTGNLSSVLGEVNDVLSILGGEPPVPTPDLTSLDWLVEDVFSFFECEGEPKCPTQENWSAWYGMDTGNKKKKKSLKTITDAAKKAHGALNSVTGAIDSVTGAIDSVTGAIDSVTGTIDSVTGAVKSVGDGFSNINFNGLYLASQCGGTQEEALGPEVCGPPRAKITGGFGADANVILTQDGQVIALDVARLGVNYSDYDANIKITDNCGTGAGSIVEARVGIANVVDNLDGTITISNGDTSSTLPGGKMGDGNLGYFDDPDQPMIPILDENGDPTPDGGETVTLIDGIVLDPGIDYLTAPDGSLGGDGRTWAEADETIIKVPTPEGPIAWLSPVSPETTIPVRPGDVVTTPATSTPIQPFPIPVPPTSIDSAPIDPETGLPIPAVDPETGLPITLDPDTGLPIGDLPIIPPGVPTTITYPSIITTPPSSNVIEPKEYPVETTDSSYPVILYLCEIIIQDPGFNYTQEDELVISPNSGATATFKLDEIGRVIAVNVDSGGEGFTEIPSIYINSETGYNATLTPKFCIDRVTDEFREPAINEKLVTVIDCTTRPPNGYLNGKPYFGPFHIHERSNGTTVKMVGSKHGSLSHAVLTDRP